MYDVVALKEAEKVKERLEWPIAALEEVKVVKARDVGKALKYRGSRTLILLEEWKAEEGALKLFAERKKACFLLPLAPLFREKGVRRAKIIREYRGFLKMCNKHGAFYSLNTLAEKEEELRSPEERCALGLLLGLNRGQAKFSLKMVEHYLKRAPQH